MSHDLLVQMAYCSGKESTCDKCAYITKLLLYFISSFFI